MMRAALSSQVLLILVTPGYVRHMLRPFSRVMPVIDADRPYVIDAAGAAQPYAYTSAWLEPSQDPNDATRHAAFQVIGCSFRR